MLMRVESGLLLLILPLVTACHSSDPVDPPTRSNSLSVEGDHDGSQVVSLFLFRLPSPPALQLRCSAVTVEPAQLDGVRVRLDGYVGDARPTRPRDEDDFWLYTDHSDTLFVLFENNGDIEISDPLGHKAWMSPGFADALNVGLPGVTR